MYDFQKLHRKNGRNILDFKFFRKKDTNMPTLNIVMVEPEIPQNTGNVARTCAATGARLHLVGPMGFRIDDTKLKRAGLDYSYLLDISYYDGLEDFFAKNPERPFLPRSFSSLPKHLIFTPKWPTQIIAIYFSAKKRLVCQNPFSTSTRILQCGFR